MSRIVSLHLLEELSHEESKDEILLSTKTNTELHVISRGQETIIRLPFGNKFDVIDGVIIIHEI